MDNNLKRKEKILRELRYKIYEHYKDNIISYNNDKEYTQIYIDIVKIIDNKLHDIIIEIATK